MALGFGAGPPPDRLLVSNAALALLRQAAARAPLLLIVDDLPWIDRASAGVLSFVARRLGRQQGRAAGGLPDRRGRVLRPGGLPEYELKPLDDQAAAQLLAARFPDLDAPVRTPGARHRARQPARIARIPAGA